VRRASALQEGTEFDKKFAAALPGRDNGAVQSCLTPNPAMKAIAITIYGGAW
jgi:hypothetical protein